ncbi:MAG: hypothetical protein WED10_05505 [Brumimicrobium sp.]
METRLLYILEKEMDENLSKLLNSFKFAKMRLIILVELNPIEVDSMPMIYDFKEIRLSKVKEKVKNWLDFELTKGVLYELIVFEGKPTKNNPPDTLDKINQLKVFVRDNNDIRIVPYLKVHLQPNQITFYKIDKLVNDYLPQRINK